MSNSNQQDRLALTENEKSALQILVNAKTPLAVFGPRRKYMGSTDREYHFSSWKSAKPSLVSINKAKRGSAVAALTGETFDVVDVDPRNGGNETFAALSQLLPETFAIVETPGSGKHFYIPPTGFPVVRFGGIDYLGKGGLVFLPGTLRPKYQYRGYKWLDPLRIDPLQQPDTRFVEALIEMSSAEAKSKSEIHRPNVIYTDYERGELVNSYQVISWAHNQVALAPIGIRNTKLNQMAFVLGMQLPNEPYLLAIVAESLLGACRKNGLAKEVGEGSCLSSINSGFLSAQHRKG